MSFFFDSHMAQTIVEIETNNQAFGNKEAFRSELIHKKINPCVFIHTLIIFSGLICHYNFVRMLKFIYFYFKKKIYLFKNS